VPRGKFLANAPSDSLFVVRVPAMNALRGAWKQSAIAKLLEHPSLQQMMSAAGGAMKPAWHELEKKLPGGNLDELLACFTGEALFAV
jgi:hypothetical protein